MELQVTFKHEHWMNALKTSGEIDSIQFIEEAPYDLKIKENIIFIPGMSMLVCYKDDKVFCRFAVSKSLLASTNQEFIEQENLTHFYFYFNEREDFVQINDEIYIAEKEVPEELEKIIREMM